MKLAFLTSSLAPGKDGVGDYTRQLARAVSAEGHGCLLLGLHDTEAADERDGDFGKVRRFSRGLPWNQRVLMAQAELDAFHPDWVSLQFVAYGFHPHGLSFGVARHLTRLLRTARRHVMLHELWIGEALSYGRKDRALGWLQRAGVRWLLHRIQPEVLHTSNPTYLQLLQTCGVTARELPLPGNIPLAEPDLHWWNAEWTALGLHRADCLLVGVFGTIHPDWESAESLRQLAKAARELKRQLVVVQLGQTSLESVVMLGKLVEKLLRLGTQPVSRISTAMQQLDAGLSTSPRALLGKSGSVAALLDHGVPVILPVDRWRLRHGITPEPAPHSLLIPEAEIVAAARAGRLKRQPAKSRLPAVAAQFLRDLREA